MFCFQKSSEGIHWFSLSQMPPMNQTTVVRESISRNRNQYRGVRSLQKCEGRVSEELIPWTSMARLEERKKKSGIKIG